MLSIPRIARRRPWQVEARPAHRKLMRRQLSQHYRAGISPFAHHRRILCRHIVLQQARVSGGTDAGGVVDILVRDRDAVEPAALRAGHEPRLGGFCIGQGPLLGHEKKTMQRPVQLGDTRQAVLRQFNRRDFLRRQRRRGGCNGVKRLHLTHPPNSAAGTDAPAPPPARAPHCDCAP